MARPVRTTSLTLAGALVALAVTDVRAEPAAAVGEVRVADGVDDVDAMRLGLVGAGLRWRVAPTLDVHVLALALATAGTADLGEPGRGGGGGELGARITPWPRAPVRPYATAALGGLLFLREPFLPGGDFYEGIITFGVGADAPVASRLVVGAHAYSVHLSNGQGLGPFNPAYDGFGATLSVAYALRAGATEPAAAPPAPRPTTPARDVVADVAIGAVDDASFAGARARPSARLGPHLVAALDLEAGTLAEELGVDVGLDVVATAGPLRGGVHAAYRRYAGIDVAVATAQAELRVTPELDVVVMGHHERPDLFDPLWRAAVGMRLAPTPTLTLDLGVGFDRLGDDSVFGDDHSDPYLGIEWRSPVAIGDRHLACFLERQVSTLDVVGVRLIGDAPAWRRVR